MDLKKTVVRWEELALSHSEAMGVNDKVLHFSKCSEKGFHSSHHKPDTCLRWWLF